MKTSFFSFSRFWRWHPKIALRYLPIVDEINSLRSGDYTVLEIGSGSLGIAPYLNHQVTGIDVDFSGPSFPLLKPIKGDAKKLPFKNNSFDFIVCVDVLEHINPIEREKVIAETFRVAKRAVFIGVPCGKVAEQQDEALHKEYKKRFSKDYSFLKEQIDYGLPDKTSMIELINNAAKKLNRSIRLTTYGNLNISVRKFLMYGWMTKNIVVDILFRKVFLLLIPILRLCNWEPTYRTFFFVYFKN